MDTKKYEELASGLIVPKEPPPKRKYRRLEIQGEENRVKAKEALIKLWSAMGLNCPPRGIFMDRTQEEYDILFVQYKVFAQLILGEDAPEGEILT